MCSLDNLMISDVFSGECIKNLELITQLFLRTYITIDKNIYETEQVEEEYNFTRNIIKEEKLLKYLCYVNYCNNRTIAQLVKQTVNDQYNLSTLYKILQGKFIRKQEEYSKDIFEDNSSTSSIFSTEITTSSSIYDSSTRTETIITTTNNITTTHSLSTITITKQSNNTSILLKISIKIIIFHLFILFFLNIYH